MATVSTPTAAGSPAAAAAAKKEFFSHSLPMIDDASNAGYYTRLYEEHLGVAMSRELQEHEADFATACVDLAKANVSEAATPFAHNDGLQNLYDINSSAFAAADAWDKRRVALKQATAAFFGKVAVVLGAQFQHPLCKTAGGFARRDVAGKVYLHAGEGLYMRMWRSASQAKAMAHAHMEVAQLLFELQIKLVRVPIVTVVAYRGITVTVTLMPPMLPDAPPGVGDAFDPASIGGKSTSSASPGLQAELQLLRGALSKHGRAPADWESFGLRRGLDGRVYITSVNWYFQSLHCLEAASRRDQSIVLRPEATAILVAERVLPAPDRNAPMGASSRPISPPKAAQSPAVLSEHLLRIGVPKVMDTLRAEAKRVDLNVGQLLSQSVVSKTMHENGLNLRFIGRVAEKYEVTKTSGEEVDKVCRELLDLEMVGRAMKEMLRSELWASTGEDEKGHVNRMNRLFQCASAKKTNVWNGHVLPILRQKFDMPPEYTITLTATLLKYMTAFFASRIGATYDKVECRFSGFTSIHQGVGVISMPREFADAQNVNKSQKDEDTSPELSRVGSMSQSMSGSFAGGRGAASPSVPKTGSQQSILGGTAGRSQYLPVFAQTWKEVVSYMTPALVAPGALGTSSDGSVNDVVPGISHATSQLIRVLVLERLFSSDSFESHRQEVLRLLGPPDVRRGPLGCLSLRIFTMVDAIKATDRMVLDEQVNRLTGEDDVILRARYAVQSGKSEGSVERIVEGCKLFKNARHIDVGLVPDYFATLAQTASILNANMDSALLNVVLRLMARVCERSDVPVRRQQCIAVFRKTSASLVASQNVTACNALREAMTTSLKIHVNRFGQEDTQTSVCFAQCVYVHANGNLNKLKDAHVLELRKFHYFVSSMGTSTIDALKDTLRGEPYNTSLSKMIEGLQDIGEDTLAAKAFIQASMAVGEQIAQAIPALVKASGMLQTGAASRLQRLVRSIRTTGNEVMLKRSNFMSGAFRQGVDIILHEEYLRMKRLELEERSLADRPVIARDEAKERQKIVDQVWRNRYESRRDERVVEKRDFATKGVVKTKTKGGVEGATSGTFEPEAAPQPVVVTSIPQDVADQLERDRAAAQKALEEEQEVAWLRLTSENDSRVIHIKEMALRRAEWERKRRVDRQTLEDDEIAPRRKMEMYALITTEMLALEGKEGLLRPKLVSDSLRGMQDAAAAFLASGKVLALVAEEETARCKAIVDPEQQRRTELRTDFQTRLSILQGLRQVQADEASARRATYWDALRTLAVFLAENDMRLIAQDEVLTYDHMKKAMSDPRALAKLQAEAKAREQALAQAQAEQRAAEQRFLAKQRDERLALQADESSGREKTFNDWMATQKTVLELRRILKSIVAELRHEMEARASHASLETTQRQKLVVAYRGATAACLARAQRHVAGQADGDGAATGLVKRELDAIRKQNVETIKDQKRRLKAFLEFTRSQEAAANLQRAEKIRAETKAAKQERMNSPRPAPESDKWIEADIQAAQAAAREKVEKTREAAREERKQHHETLLMIKERKEREAAARRAQVLQELERVHAMAAERQRREDEELQRQREAELAACGPRANHFSFAKTAAAPSALSPNGRSILAPLSPRNSPANLNSSVDSSGPNNANNNNNNSTVLSGSSFDFESLQRRERLISEACLAIREEEQLAQKEKARQTKLEEAERKQRLEQQKSLRIQEIRAIADRRREQRKRAEEQASREQDATKQLVADERTKHLQALHEAQEAKRQAAKLAAQQRHEEVERLRHELSLKEEADRVAAEKAKEERLRREKIMLVQKAALIRAQSQRTLSPLRGAATSPPPTAGTPPPPTSAAK